MYQPHGNLEIFFPQEQFAFVLQSSPEQVAAILSNCVVISFNSNECTRRTSWFAFGYLSLDTNESFLLGSALMAEKLPMYCVAGMG